VPGSTFLSEGCAFFCIHGLVSLRFFNIFDSPITFFGSTAADTAEPSATTSINSKRKSRPNPIETAATIAIKPSKSRSSYIQKEKGKKMQSSRFSALAAHLTPSALRTSFRRSSSLSSSTGGGSRPASLRSSRDVSGSPVMTINSIVLRQPSYLELEAEKRSYASELSILEPRPVVYWESMEERMGSF
jgi:hypothetical protein